MVRDNLHGQMYWLSDNRQSVTLRRFRIAERRLTKNTKKCRGCEIHGDVFHPFHSHSIPTPAQNTPYPSPASHPYGFLQQNPTQTSYLYSYLLKYLFYRQKHKLPNPRKPTFYGSLFTKCEPQTCLWLTGEPQRKTKYP